MKRREFITAPIKSLRLAGMPLVAPVSILGGSAGPRLAERLRQKRGAIPASTARNRCRAVDLRDWKGAAP
jgi:hypothetical protein